MKREELNEKLRLHGMWLCGEPGGIRADFSGSDLYGSDLRGVDLREAILYGANLHEANLYGANLREANLREANLREANLREAILREANLYGANLRKANLYGADLREANLREAILCEANLREALLREASLYGADLREANLREAILREANLYGADLREANLREAILRGAKNVDAVITDAYTAFYALQCPESGAYTAYKKSCGLIVKLEIPADAMRSSATSRRCRASKAKVISITDVDGNPAREQVASNYDPNFIYVVGKTVEVPDFDTDRWNECAPGIHHYITRAEAVNHI